MVIKDVQLLLDNQRQCHNDEMSRLEKRFIDYIKNTESNMAELRASLEFAHSENKDLKDELASLKSTIKNNNEQHQQLQPAVAELARRLDYMDDQGRKINLRFCGIPEQPHETHEQAQLKVMQLLQSKLNTTPDIQVAHRIGKPSTSKPRDILSKFRNASDRDAVYRKRTSMKGTNVFINEDLCPGIVAARQVQSDPITK